MNTSKTLLQILVEQLPKNGGWYDNVKTMTQDKCGDIWGYNCTAPRLDGTMWKSKSGSDLIGYAKIQAPYTSVDWNTAIITREQYEAAVLAATTQATITMPADGWIDWAGGECPVQIGTAIDFKCRNGRVFENKTVGRIVGKNWGNLDLGSDIIAYRLSKLQEVEPVELGQTTADHAHVGQMTGINGMTGAVDGMIAREVETRAEIAQAVDDLNECIGQTPAPVWNGCGVPPVGAEIEWRSGRLWYPGTITAISEMMFIIKDQRGEEGGYYRDQTDIRAANFERDELAAIIESSVDKHSPFVDLLTLVASDLIAAGYRKQ